MKFRFPKISMFGLIVELWIAIVVLLIIALVWPVPQAP